MESYISTNKIIKPNETYFNKDTLFEEFDPNSKEYNYINK